MTGVSLFPHMGVSEVMEDPQVTMGFNTTHDLDGFGYHPIYESPYFVMGWGGGVG